MLPDRVYHLADAANWPLIARDGLLCASRLMKASGLADSDRNRLERFQRPEHVELPNKVQIRDQRPLPASALQKCLVGMSPSQWYAAIKYAAINARVFFWLHPERLNRQRAACEPRPQVVLTVDTQTLVKAHAPRIAVTPINTGNARRRPARRGRASFVPLAEWLSSSWAGEAAALGIPMRKTSHRPVELTVLDAVPDIVHFVVNVSALKPGESFAAPVGLPSS